MGVQTSFAARYSGPMATRAGDLDVPGADLHIAGYTATDARGRKKIFRGG